MLGSPPPFFAVYPIHTMSVHSTNARQGASLSLASLSVFCVECACMTS